MFANDIIPSGEKEQTKTKDKVLVFTAPLKKERQKRGTVELFEDEETKKLTVGGKHREHEEEYIRLENPYDKEEFKLLISFAYSQRLLNLYKNTNENYFLLSPETRNLDANDRRVISFTYKDYNKYPASVLYQ
jgi:hypothetical protein